MITQNVRYMNLPDCLRLSNETVELILTTAVGPRIVRYAFLDGENIFGEHGEVVVQTALGEWKPYGGHRLWIAPENMPNSYAPDNSLIKYIIEAEKNMVRLIQPIEETTKTQKEIVVTLAETGSEVKLEHKITNFGNSEIKISAWALTIMSGNGAAIIPNEDFAPYSPTALLPVRNLALWSYTDLTDPRWSFEKNTIRLQVDETRDDPQKIGVLNKQGWAAYEKENLRFVKRFEFVENAVYPDYNSNTEIYTAGAFVEVETLSPLTRLLPGEFVSHIEHWELSQIQE